MPPVVRNVKKTGAVVRQVQPTVPTHITTAPVSKQDQVQQFREARKLREQERLEKLRNCRLNNSSCSAAVVSAQSFKRSRPQPSASSKVTSNVTEMKSAVSSNVKGLKPGVSSSAFNEAKSRATAHSMLKMTSNVRENKSSTSKLRRSLGSRKSITKTKIGCSKLKAPKAEVKLTKTSRLRMLKADPLLQLSFNTTSSFKQLVLPVPEPIRLRKKAVKLPCNFEGVHSPPKMLDPKATDMQAVTGTTPKKPLGHLPVEDSQKLQTPSQKPVRKASFVSPVKQTPKPSPLRERLASWLEKRNHSLDNFKHLKCFGVLGPVVKRPQTPFRKVIQSSSLLKAIPESKESTPSKDNFEDLQCEDDVSPLNTTFTLEDEDKENVCSSDQVESTSTVSVIVHDQQGIKELDQAYGVLSELHKLIQMGYPLEQCSLWLRAVRRRFPQCGDESIYWECLAALEEARGDLQTAFSCYERAILQGAEESSIQSSLDELLKKMSSLCIEPVVRVAREKPLSTHDEKSLDSSNIIKSSTIQFAVKEKFTPSKKTDKEALDESDALFTATPVRRSGRLARTPRQETPGVKCVKSLEFLEPDVRRSLIFHTNSALQLED